MSRLMLAFDTATEECAIALGAVEAGRVHLVAERDFDAPRSSLSQLLPAVASMFDSVGAHMGDLDGLVVGCGPGSFTGVRIGVCTAKGIAHALGVPLYGVGTLDAIARRFVHTDVLLGVVGDAMRGEVYPAVFECGASNCVRLDPDKVAFPADVAREWASSERAPGLLVGNGLRRHADVFAEAMGERCILAGQDLWTPTGRGLLEVFADDLEQGREGDGDASAVLPIYTRLSDAEENEAAGRGPSVLSGGSSGSGVPSSGVNGPRGGER